MIDPLSYKYRFIILLVLLGLLLLAGVILAKGETPLRSEPDANDDYLNSYRQIAPHYVPYVQTYGSLIEGNITQKQAELIDCVWKAESSRGQNLFGDYREGVPQAFGHFQVWLIYHPITYECSMDFDCSSAYFLEMVEQGKGKMWTTYNNCL